MHFTLKPFNVLPYNYIAMWPNDETNWARGEYKMHTFNFHPPRNYVPTTKMKIGSYRCESLGKDT